LNERLTSMLHLKYEDIPEEGLTLKWTEEKASLGAYLKDFSKINFDFETPLQSEVHVLKMGRSVLIKGQVQTDLRLLCVRCLKEFSYPLFSTFELTLHPIKETSSKEEAELEEKDLESGYFEEGEIYLSEIACEQIFLEIPYKPLCHENCKGLCSICGKDLNLFSCTCVSDEISSSFSVLQKLKLDKS
jgi:uncharacterized protein